MYSKFKTVPSFPAEGYRGGVYRQSVRIPPNYQGTAIGAPPPDGVSPVGDGVMLPSGQKDRPQPAALPPLGPAEAAEAPQKEKDSPLSRLLSGEGFPFGHGMGFEELFLLGLMLFLLREGREDPAETGDLTVTVALLGALLFFG